MKRFVILMTLCVGVFAMGKAQNKVLSPYKLAVTYEKTTHLIFPSAIRYVDLGSNNLIAGKPQDADNVLRVKASVRDFQKETNLSVMCEDGSLYTFNVTYSEKPEKLTMEMGDFLQTNAQHYPTNSQPIYWQELVGASPVLVELIMKTIWKNDKKELKHIGQKRFGMQFSLKGLYAHNGLLYFHTQLKNKTRIGYQSEILTFKIVDKKIAKRTAIQEQVLTPLRVFNEIQKVGKRQNERSVYVLEQFCLPEDKKLVVTLFEKNGGRTLSFEVENEDLLRCKEIANLKLKI